MVKSSSGAKNRKKKKKPAGHAIQPFFTGLGVILMLAVALSLYFSQEDKMTELEQKNKELTEQAEVMKAKEDEIRKLLENWQTPEYIEKIAREQLGMVKPGEMIFKD